MMKSWAQATLAAAVISSGVASGQERMMFSRTEPSNKRLSWGRCQSGAHRPKLKFGDVVAVEKDATILGLETREQLHDCAFATATATHDPQRPLQKLKTDILSHQRGRLVEAKINIFKSNFTSYRR